MTKTTLEQIRSLLKQAKHPAFIGGAGVSTASGIPDFRSPQGIYNVESEYGVPYETMLSHSFFMAHPDQFYDFYWKAMVHEGAKPNKAHIALAEFGHRKRLPIITQNIDGLHQMAGSDIVYEPHGSIRTYHCERCGKLYELVDIPHQGIPKCSCGGILKPDVVLYEEALDEEVIENCLAELRFCDVLIIGGTSMRVYPVAAFPEYMLSGTKIIINAEPTPYDEQCDYVIHEDIGDTLEAILGENDD